MNKSYIKSSIWGISIIIVLILTMLVAMGIGRYSIGIGLAIAGASFQSLFSNPLATPDTLGVATGASFGAA